MERTTFDHLTRLFATTRTRRSTLRLAVGALLGGAATIDGVAAKGRKKRGTVHSDAASPPCIGDNLPRICLIPGGTGCGEPDGNCANKKIGPGANLTNACFFEAGLEGADFRGANLKGATFCLADLTGADFRGSNLTTEQLAHAERFSCTTILPNGKPAVPCDADQICCGAVCCAPENCEQNTCVEPPRP
jgi:hypothetical protein